MKDRNPFDLKFIMMFYNLFQVVSNLWLGIYVSWFGNLSANLILIHILGRVLLLHEKFIRLQMPKRQFHRRWIRNDGAEALLLLLSAQSVGFGWFRNLILTGGRFAKSVASTFLFFLLLKALKASTTHYTNLSSPLKLSAQITGFNFPAVHRSEKEGFSSLVSALLSSFLYGGRNVLRSQMGAGRACHIIRLG